MPKQAAPTEDVMAQLVAALQSLGNTMQSGISVPASQLPPIFNGPTDWALPSTQVARISPLSLMQQTYGGQTQSVLASRAANRERLMSQLTGEEQAGLPTLDPRILSQQIPLYLLPSGVGVSGSAGITYPRMQPPAVVVSGNETGNPDTIAHEMTHAAHALGQQPVLQPAGASLDRGIQMNKFQSVSPAITGNADIRQGIGAIESPTEMPAYLTPIARYYFEKTGKTIDSQQQARDALDLYMRDRAPNKFQPVEQGSMAGLRQSVLALILLQMLAANKQGQAANLA